jgi:hypothetical protein
METKAKSIDRQCKEHLAQQGITSMDSSSECNENHYTKFSVVKITTLKTTTKITAFFPLNQK